VVSRRALADTCPASRAALEIFCDTYADVAADLSLALNAGAVWLTGGVTPRILPFLRPRFRAAFEAKGRYRAFLEQVPVRVVTHPDPGLLGARLVAQARLG
jgi:glucokinase